MENKKRLLRDEFKDRLRNLRNEIGVTQKELADELGVSRAAIGYYENGLRLPDIEFLQKLCRTTGCSPDYFLEGGNKVAVSNDFFENNGLNDVQLDTLAALLQSPAFREMLNQAYPMRDLFAHVDAFADYGIEYNGDFISALVSQITAARFIPIVDKAYHTLDVRARFNKKYELEHLNNPDKLNISQKKDAAFIKLVENFRELNKQQSILHNKEWHAMRATPSATNADQNATEKFETFRQKMEALSQGK